MQLLLATTLISGWLAATCFAGPLLDGRAKAIERINQYLVENDPKPADPESGIATAAELLQSLQLKTGEEQTQVSNEELAKALEDFIKLKSLAEGRCDREGYAVMRTNNDHLPATAAAVTRIVHHYSAEHAKKCQLHYKQTFEKLYNNLQHEQPIQWVEQYLNELIAWRLFNSSPELPSFQLQPEALFDGDSESESGDATTRRQLFIDELVNGKTLRGLGEPEIAFKSVMSHLAGSRSMLMFRRPDKVKNMVRTYLVEPCEFYLRNLGPDVFVPANYELSQHFLPDSLQFQPFNKDQTKYYTAWAHFNMCHLLVEDEQLGLTSDIMAQASREGRNSPSY